jgi:hypothetical protein
MVMLDDYFVSFLSEGTIGQIATERRAAMGHRNSPSFNITDCVERMKSDWRKKGKFCVKFFDAAVDQKPAYVTFNPPTMHIDREVWKLAKLGEPEARFIVAHELGHLFLHDHHAKAFSELPSERIKYAENENSAEWQADTFAEHFLLPDHLVEAFYDARDLAASCNVSESLARKRLEAIVDRDRRRKRSDICSKCGNFTLNSNGRCTSESCVTVSTLHT